MSSPPEDPDISLDALWHRLNDPRPRSDRHRREGNSGQPPASPIIGSASELRTKVFPPIEYVVPACIVQGCTLFCGKPKIGKSWLCLDVGLAVARGGECLGGVTCPQGDVLFLGLEDNERRLQDRMTKILGYAKDWPPGFHYATEWPRGEAGLEPLRNWVTAGKNPRLIVVDVLAMFRPHRTDKQTNYDADYAALQGLRRLGSDMEVAILAVHHLRKQGADQDVFEKVSGTFGLSGAADTVLIIDRDASGTTLYGRGRDIPEIEKAIEFDKETCRWRVLGNPADVRRTNERKAILAVLQAADGVAMQPKEIAAATGMPLNNIYQLLLHMGKAGEVQKADRGRYVTNLNLEKP
jgi:hypothetical protein